MGVIRKRVSDHPVRANCSAIGIHQHNHLAIISVGHKANSTTAAFCHTAIRTKEHSAKFAAVPTASNPDAFAHIQVGSTIDLHQICEASGQYGRACCARFGAGAVRRVSFTYSAIVPTNYKVVVTVQTSTGPVVATAMNFIDGRLTFCADRDRACTRTKCSSGIDKPLLNPVALD